MRIEVLRDVARVAREERLGGAPVRRVDVVVALGDADGHVRGAARPEPHLDEGSGPLDSIPSTTVVVEGRAVAKGVANLNTTPGVAIHEPVAVVLEGDTEIQSASNE